MLRLSAERKAWLRRIWQRWAKDHLVSRFNAVSLLLAVGTNYVYQAFCLPTVWAGIVFAIACISTVVLPHTRKLNEDWQTVVGFLAALSAGVWLYCTLFLGEMHLLMLITLWIQPLTLLTWLPLFLFAQCFWQGLIKSPHPRRVLGFSVGATLCLVFCIRAYSWYGYHASALRVGMMTNDFEGIKRDYMSEKIIGIGFLYHLKFCIYDGWRPPLHEPLLVVGYWLHRDGDPLRGMPLRRRIALYQSLFPETPLPYPCPCALSYSEQYFRDSLWRSE